MTAGLFGFAGEPVTPLSCEEYDALWDQLSGSRPYEEGRWRVSSSYTDEDVMMRTWGFGGQDVPALGEETLTGHACRHWLFAQERTTLDDTAAFDPADRRQQRKEGNR